MASFVHVVGAQGVGKSLLISALAAQYVSRGLFCAGQDPAIFMSKREALKEAPGADVYFIEHIREDDLDASPGELVIRIEWAPTPQEPSHGA